MEKNSGRWGGGGKLEVYQKMLEILVSWLKVSYKFEVLYLLPKPLQRIQLNKTWNNQEQMTETKDFKVLI